MTTEKPAQVSNVKASGKVLQWNGTKRQGKTTDVVRYVIYRFELKDKHPDFENAEAIVGITNETEYKASRSGCYYVTALNRANIESQPSNAVTIK
jgi:hypothetical protein